MARILIIDSERPLLNLVGRVCERMGHQVSAHLSGRAGIAAFIRESPDLVITQLRIPDVNGLQIIRDCMAHDPNAKFLALSGYDGVEGGEAAVMLGAMGYQLIPCALEEMERTIQQVLAKGGNANPPTDSSAI